MKRAAARAPRRGCGCLAAILLVSVVVAVGLGGPVLEGAALRRPVVGPAPVSVTVPAGGTMRGILNDAWDTGTLQGPGWMRWLALRRAPDCLRAGRHVLPESASLLQVFDTLCRNPRPLHPRITLREGLTRWHIADRLSEAGIVERDALLAAIAARPVELPDGSLLPDAEGLLFPETLEWAPGTAADAVVERLLAEGLRQVQALVDQGVEPPDGLSWADTLRLASLVEAEAAVEEERPRIAQVFLNRIRAGMRMQADPTCTYHPDRYGRPATPAWCRDRDHRWSTYTHDGLPPTPIANPGRAAIEAVLRPSGEQDLLYFVAVGDGSRRHTFSRTLDEHRRGVDALRRQRAATPDPPP